MKSPLNYRFFFDLYMRQKVSPFYCSTIKNKLLETKWELDQDQNFNFDSFKFALVKDIPAYLETSTLELGAKIKQAKIRQYKGFLLNLSNCTRTEDYLTAQLSARNRKNLRSKMRKLETEHKIKYHFFHGEISKIDYDFLFQALYRLLDTRFNEKKTHNVYLKDWKYYYELVYPMIFSKEASLFVIYDNKKPITIVILFHNYGTVFSFIQGYDIHYSGYNMGDISLLKQIDWCLNNNIALLDLSMGITDFKLKWCNTNYDLDYHIFYNTRSISSLLQFAILKNKLQLKQYLRDKGVLGKLFNYTKFRYLLANLIGKTNVIEQKS